MKQQQFKLGKDNPENRAKVYNTITRAIKELPADQDFSVKIGNYDSSKTAKQRRLDWRWNNEIEKSGFGGANADGENNNAEDIHLNGKWMFAKNLLLAGEDDYSLWVADMWQLIVEKYPQNPDKQKLFFIYAVHTEKMTVEMVSEYLRLKQYYWTDKGVNLTDPSLAGLDLLDGKAQ